MTVPRLALEVWDAIKGEDWVLTTGDLGSWGKKRWNFDRPYCHAGRELGTGTQIGLSLGVALANKGSGRLVVDLQPDGDLMFDAGSLWIAAKYQIPMLIVMFNNRAYYNDWNHQLVLARTRGTDPNRAHIGMDLFGPDPDFAGLARSMGWYAEGPIENADDLKPAFMIKLMQKDLRIVQEAAQASGLPLPGTALAQQLFRAVEALPGGAGLGTQAMIRALRSVRYSSIVGYMSGSTPG